MVNTGKLYDEPHLAAGVPTAKGGLELVFPGERKTIVVSAADRKKLNIKCVDAVDADKVTYDPDRVNKYRNNLLRDYVRDRISDYGAVENFLTLDVNPFDPNSSAQAVAPFAQRVYVPENDMDTAALHLKEWIKKPKAVRDKIIPSWEEVDAVASRTKCDGVYLDLMTPDTTLAEMVLGKTKTDYNTMPRGGIFAYTINKRTGVKGKKNPAKRVKKAIAARGGTPSMTTVARANSCIVTFFSSIP